MFANSVKWLNVNHKHSLPAEEDESEQSETGRDHGHNVRKTAGVSYNLSRRESKGNVMCIMSVSFSVNLKFTPVHGLVSDLTHAS